jgi:hypothetical protein
VAYLAEISNNVEMYAFESYIINLDIGLVQNK